MNIATTRFQRVERLLALAGTVALVAVLLPLQSAAAAPGGATKLMITATTLVGNATAGVPFNVTLQAQDNAGAVATGFTDPVAFASTDPQAIVSPASPYTYVAGDIGTHQFSVTLKTSGSRTITFSASGLTSATANITVDPGVTRRLVVTQQPSTAPANGAFVTQPKITVQDDFGNIVTTEPTDVTLAIKAGTGTNNAVLTCTGNVANKTTTVAGVATFSGCSVNLVGIGYILTASDATAGHSPAYTAANTNPFDVADNLAFEVQPGGGAGSQGKAQGGVPFTNQPRVIVRAGSTKAVNDSTTYVTLSIKPGTGTAGAKLTCDQAGNIQQAIAGLAQFSNCRIDKAGTGYKLIATSVPAYGSNAWDHATAFDVVAGPATKLTFVVQPAGAAAGQAFTTQPVVAITDAGGNVVTSGVSANVTLSFGANPGVPAGILSCVPGVTVATATSGVNAGKAVFSGCKITSSGTGYILNAFATSIVGVSALASTSSDPFTVTAPGATITLTNSASVITWGQGVTLNIQFGVNGANKTFTIERTRDSFTWFTEATLTTNASGFASYVYRPAVNHYFRIRFAGAADLTAGLSNTTRTVVRQIALLRPTNGGVIKSIARNTSITFTTTVRPARPELPKAVVHFVFYRLSGGSWTFVTARDVTIDSLGLASTTFKFTTAGTWYVRSTANPIPSYNANSVWSPLEKYYVR